MPPVRKSARQALRQSRNESMTSKVSKSNNKRTKVQQKQKTPSLDDSQIARVTNQVILAMQQQGLLKHTEGTGSQSNEDNNTLQLESELSNDLTQGVSEVFPSTSEHIPQKQNRKESSEILVQNNNQVEMVEAVQNAVDGIIGESVPHDIEVQKAEFQPLGTPLGATVPTKTKAKIWANEFVQLHSLLTGNDDQDFTVSIKKQDGGHAISMLPTSGTKDIKDIQQWTKAMMVLGAIYTQQHPNQAPALFKYIDLVRSIQSSYPHANWQYYDIQFRKLKAVYGWTWDHVHWELYFRCASQPGKNTPLIKQPFRIPRGYCWAFHRGDTCTQKECVYSHSCFRCGESHSFQQTHQPHVQKRAYQFRKFQNAKINSITDPTKSSNTSQRNKTRTLA